MKPKPMKPVKAWAIVTRRGLCLDLFGTMREAKRETYDGDRVIRVEIREVRRAR